MTTLKLDTLSDRIKAHKNALVHIRNRRSVPSARSTILRCINNISISRSGTSRAGAGASPANRTIWIKHDELIIGNRASEVRAAPIFPEYTVSWIEKRLMIWQIVPVLALR